MCCIIFTFVFVPASVKGLTAEVEGKLLVPKGAHKLLRARNGFVLNK